MEAAALDSTYSRNINGLPKRGTNTMKRISRLLLVIAALAVFLTGFQARSARAYFPGGTTGDVPVISG